MSDTADTTQTDAAQVDATQASNTQVEATQAELHPVIAETLETFKSEGIAIEPSDPEYKSLDAILKDPGSNIHKYRKELYKQIEAKRERLSQPAKPAETSETARTIGNPNPSAWEQAYTKPVSQAHNSPPKPAANSYEAWSQGYKNKP